MYNEMNLGFNNAVKIVLDDRNAPREISQNALTQSRGTDIICICFG